MSSDPEKEDPKPDRDKPDNEDFFDRLICGIDEELGDFGLPTSAPALRMPPLDADARLDSFRIVRAIGHGGMGWVYEAFDESLRRPVALKVLSRDHATPEWRIRFEREAWALSRIHHDSIVAIYSHGEAASWLYIAMEHVPGCSLEEFLQRGKRVQDSHASHETPYRRPLPVPVPEDLPRSDESARYCRWIAARAAEVADALDAAHVAGVVHRDVKPGNLLIESASRWKLSDFGIARLDSEETVTVATEQPFTLRYASPEQANRSAQVDCRTDIYSLGATLYECLTHSSPSPGGTTQEQLENKLHGHRPPIKKGFPSVPADLSAIVEKAMEVNRKRRYQRAGDLADDLRRFARGEPVGARPIGLLRRTGKWAKRRPAIAVSVAASLLIAAGAAAWAIGAAIDMRVSIAFQRATLERYGPFGPIANIELRIPALYDAHSRAPRTQPGRELATLIGTWMLDIGMPSRNVRAFLAQSYGDARPLDWDVRLALYERDFAAAAARLGDSPPSHWTTIAGWTRRFAHSRIVEIPLALAGSVPQRDAVAIVRRNTPRSEAYLAAVIGDDGKRPAVGLIPLGAARAPAPAIPCSEIFSDGKGFSDVRLLAVLALSDTAPVLGVLARPDGSEDCALALLRVDEGTLKTTTILCERFEGLVEEGRSIEWVDLDRDGTIDLLLGLSVDESKDKPIQRFGHVYSLTSSPGRFGLQRRCNLPVHESVLNGIAVDATGKNRTTAYLALGYQRGMGIQICSWTEGVDRSWLAARDVGSTDEEPIGLVPFGNVNDVLLAEMDGAPPRELLVAVGRTDSMASTGLSGAFDEGVPDGLYACVADGQQLPMAFPDGSSVDYLPTWNEDGWYSRFEQVTRADLDGDGSDEILADTLVKTNYGERRVLRIERFDPGLHGLAEPVRVLLSPDAINGDSSSALLLESDVDGEPGDELILVDGKRISILGERGAGR